MSDNVSTEKASSTWAVTQFAATKWRYVRYPVAILLLFTAGTKIVNMIEILAGDGLLASRPMLLAVIGFESAVGIFLLIGDSFWAWVLTGITFVAFSGFLAYAIASGQDCNCVSRAIGPKLMLPFDLTVLILVWWVRPAARVGWNKRLLLEITGALALGIFVAGSASLYDPPEHSDPLQFLLADMMISQRWPLNATLHPTLATLDEGNWMVMVVRRDCEHCVKLLAKHFVDPQNHRPNERTAVFLAGQSEWPFQFDEISIDIQTDTSISWSTHEPFVASPAIFLIKNGIVVQGSDGKEANAFLDEVMSEIP